MCTMEDGSAGPCEGDLSPRSDLRKSNKPLMEKKRRQRINRCLNDLKTLVLEALKKDPSRYSKLEKADILEMTVRHVQALHRHESTNGRTISGGRITSFNGRLMGIDEKAKYRAGFNQCAVEVTRYLNGMTGVPRDLHSKIVSHLNAISSTFPGFQTLSQTVPSSHIMNGGSIGTIIPPVSSSIAKCSAVVSTAADSSTLNSPDPMPNPNPSLSGSHLDDIPPPSVKLPEKSEPTASITVGAGVTLVPARLANGQMALILPPGANIPFKSQRESISTLAGMISSSGGNMNVDSNKPEENLHKDQIAISGSVQHEVPSNNYRTDNITSGTVCGTINAKKIFVGLSVQDPQEYFKSSHKASFSRYLSTTNSDSECNESKTAVEPNRHFELSLPTNSNMCYENGTFTTACTSLRPGSSLSEDATSVSREGPLWNRVFDKARPNSPHCSHVSISVSRQECTDATGSRPDLQSTSQTVLIKPKPQLPTGLPYLHSSPVRCEQSLTYNYPLVSGVSCRTAFETQPKVPQEPLNLVVSGEEQSREESITYYSCSPSSSSSSSLPISSSSSPSPPSPSPSLPSFSAYTSLSRSPPPPSSLTGPTASSPLPSTSSSSPASSSLKAPSSFQIRKRVTPYEVPVAGTDREGQPWRPW